MLVTLDDKKIEAGGRSLYADGVNVHAILFPRASFRRIVEGSIRNSFMHSLLAKGRLLYTHDDTIADLLAQLHNIGERDTQMRMLEAATSALATIYKAHKWLLTRGDLDYTALWILYSATPLARLEIVSRRLIADREVIPQASQLNPDFFRTIYSDLLNNSKTEQRVRTALDAVDAYIGERAASVFAPIIEHLREVGETRTTTEIEDHFKRTFGVGSVTTACEYLADQGLIGKASIATRLTKRSNVDVQELAFCDTSVGRADDRRVATGEGGSSLFAHAATGRRWLRAPFSTRGFDKATYGRSSASPCRRADRVVPRIHPVLAVGDLSFPAPKAPSSRSALRRCR